ncbi:MAG: transglutaminase family protein [Cyanobacteria bacterium P01_H01_bin.119]
MVEAQQQAHQSLEVNLSSYLEATTAINWQHPEVLAWARQLASEQATVEAITQSCFEWVRDEIHHSFDYQMNPVTWRASDVLHHKTGFCFAKSHLLAALLRANQIPAGFCYQRLSLDDQGAPYSLHGFNAVYLPSIGWYRIDPRGNKDGVNAQFSPPLEHLAFQPQLPEEATFSTIFPVPLPRVIATLRSHTTWDTAWQNLPDIELREGQHAGLF